MTGTLARGTTEVVTDALFAIGSSVPVRDLTWLPDRPGRYLPLQCYLVRSATDAVFVDCGPRVIRPQLTAAEDLVSDRAVWIFTTRNEFDCLGNFGELLALREDVRLLFGGGGGILEWAHDPAADELEDRTFLDRREIVLATNGTSTDIGGLRWHWLDAPVKTMFLTQWAFEETTGTLFTSDVFGWVDTTSAAAPPVVDSAGRLPAPAEVADGLVRRAHWLPGARAAEVLERFDAVFTRFAVRRIAPVRGCVLDGPDVVARAVADTRAALRGLIA